MKGLTASARDLRNDSPVYDNNWIILACSALLVISPDSIAWHGTSVLCAESESKGTSLQYFSKTISAYVSQHI